MEMRKISTCICIIIICFITFSQCGLIRRQKRKVSSAEKVELDGEINRNITLRHDQEILLTDLPYCFETEPCQFVVVRHDPRGNTPVKNSVASWCQCRTSELCTRYAFDRKRRIEIHRCKLAGQEQEKLDDSQSSSRRRRHRHDEFGFPDYT